jgi:PAS domain S-box-containing protein
MTEFDYSPYAYIATAVFGIDVGADGVPRYAYLNPAAASATGLTLADITGRTALEVHPGRGGEIAYQRHLKAIASGQETTYLVDITSGGRTRIMRTTLQPITGSHSKVVRLVGTALEAGRKSLKTGRAKQVQPGLSEVEQFVAMAAHDLRAPMRNVRIIADMLREDFVDRGDGKLELIDLLDDVATKSSDLIDGVLQHAMSGSATPERLPFDFGLLCQTMVQVLDPTERHQITWTPAAMQADKTAIQIALRNLLDNALKHSQRDIVRIDITARSASDGTIEIAVRDDGIGFENPGQQFLETGDFRTGSGYGLLGIRRLITARGGTIRVDRPAAHAGCTVRFTLPGTLALIDIAHSARA